MDPFDDDGGVAGDVTLAGTGGPLPDDVGRTLSWLAHLLDDRIRVRGVGTGVAAMAASFLGVAPTGCVSTTQELSGLGLQLGALSLAGLLEDHPPAVMTGDETDRPPRFEVLELGRERRRVPYRLAAGFPAAAVASCPLVVALTDSWHGDTVLEVHTRLDDADEGRVFLDGLLRRGRVDNPFRGKVLEAAYRNGFGLSFRVLDLAPVDRGDVVLPAPVWAEVDRTVHGLFAAHGHLAAAGLPANRGLLLTGPPGTGKTLLCRVLASEVGDDVTVVFCDAKAVAHAVRPLYSELAGLSPALVVMEDIDLVVGERRRHGATPALVDFLLALDGATSEHQGVVTIATTNDAAAIDAAAKRSARLDRHVEVPAPDAAGRAAILRRYLQGLHGLCRDVDAEVVAAAADGATGADLRELVTTAVLHTALGGDAGITTDLLLRLAAERGYRPPAGLYL